MGKPLKEYTLLQMEAALCAWEWMLESRINTNAPDFEPDKFHEWRVQLENCFEDYGSSAMRMIAIQAGGIALAVHELMESQKIEFHSAYDWEFVPGVLCQLDWRALAEDNQYAKGKYRPNASELLRVMMERQPSDFETEKDRWFTEARHEAVKQWGWADLVSENEGHVPRLKADFEAGVSAKEAVKALGEKYDLTPAEAWRGN